MILCKQNTQETVPSPCICRYISVMYIGLGSMTLVHEDGHSPDVTYLLVSAGIAMAF